MTNERFTKDIDQLNSFLRGERSAVATYEQVIQKADTPNVIVDLQNGQESHRRRVELLETKISALGGEPAKDGGAWSALAKTVQGGAAVLGLNPAIAVLEEGEDHGLKDYRQNLDQLSPEMNTWVATQLLPEQERTHDRLSKLKQTV